MSQLCLLSIETSLQQSLEALRSATKLHSYITYHDLIIALRIEATEGAWFRSMVFHGDAAESREETTHVAINVLRNVRGLHGPIEFESCYSIMSIEVSVRCLRGIFTKCINISGEAGRHGRG